MRKKLIPVMFGIFILAGFGWLSSQQNPEDAKFAKTMESYLDAYWKFFPTSATLAGYHKYNDKLEAFAESNIEDYLKTVDKVSADLVNKISRDKLSPEAQIDFDLLRDAIDLNLLRLEKIVPQQLNPLYYNEIILQSVRSLLVKDFAAMDGRLKSATERAKALPGFIKTAKTELKTPPKEYTEEAIRKFPAILDFYRTEVPKLIEMGGVEAKSKFQTELGKAIIALEDYQRFLQADLLARSTGNFRLGEAHQRIFQLTSSGMIMLNELGARATAEAKNLRREMFLVCMPYYKIMDPKFDIENPPANITQDQLFNNVVLHVMNKIKAAQPTKEEWFNKIKSTTDEIKAFIAKQGLLDVPEDSFSIELMPALDRNSILTKLVTPTPYEQGGSYSVQINPYFESLPADQVQSFMDEYPNYMLPIWTIHNVYPGPFFPTAFTLKNASLIRKLNPNQALLQGWPLYAQDMFVYAGFNDYDLKQRLFELKLKLEALMDFQIDVSVHEGSTTKEQAIKLMTINGFQTPAEAERNWNKIVLNPNEASNAYIGYQTILDIEKEYKTAKGEAFSQKEFLKKLVSFGPLPLRILKTKITQ
ncbi:MAG: DUF885 family protein [Candidatus Aminicenantes bacterium]|nr:DUF885 family protein [Candidatus Aminicenantes bacterium]